MKYYISDTHFGHTNIIKLAGRPYSSIEHMNEDLIARWNSKVGSGDLVYHIGDFAWSHVKRYRERLNGEIILIRGNHDRRMNKQQEAFLFAGVYDYQKVKDGSHTLILFHYPIWSWDGLYKGTYHLHGHIHEKQLSSYSTEGGETLHPKGRGIRINVSVEQMDYEPKTIEEIRCQKDAQAVVERLGMIEVEDHGTH
jgi:calcineurin-like phosphoesterase family protein